MKLWRATLRLKPDDEGGWGEYKTSFNFEYMGDNWEKLTRGDGSTYHQVSRNAILDINHLSDTICIRKYMNGYIVTQAFEYELAEHETKQVEHEMIKELLNYTKEEYEDVVSDFDNKRLALFEKLALDAYVMADWGTSNPYNIWDSLPDTRRE